MNNENQQQTQEVEPISRSEIHDELQKMLEIARAVSNVGLNNTLQTVTGCEVTTIMEILLDRIEPLMDRVMPIPDKSL